MPAKLFVGNLSFQATEEDLRELFQQAGTVESVRIVTDQFTGRPRGFGFVEMATKEEARQGHRDAKRPTVPRSQPGRRRGAAPAPARVRAAAGLAAAAVAGGPVAAAEAGLAPVARP